MQQTVSALPGVKVLSKELQKRISGGVSQDPISTGTCAAESPEGLIGKDQVSKAEAQAYAAANGTHWCCDSCHSASWYADEP